jgi:hypothetical protein
MRVTICASQKHLSIAVRAGMKSSQERRRTYFLRGAEAC